MSVSINISLEH